MSAKFVVGSTFYGYMILAARGGAVETASWRIVVGTGFGHRASNFGGGPAAERPVAESSVICGRLGALCGVDRRTLVRRTVRRNKPVASGRTSMFNAVYRTSLIAAEPAFRRRPCRAERACKPRGQQSVTRRDHA